MEGPGGSGVTLSWPLPGSAGEVGPGEGGGLPGGLREMSRSGGGGERSVLSHVQDTPPSCPPV